MGVTHTTGEQSRHSPWLLLVFSLPASRASQRVEVWRKLQRYGVLPLQSSGYVLPNAPANQEKLEWLATAIRNYKGQASVVQVQAFDDLPEQKIKNLFVQARSKDYENLLRDLKKLVALSPSRRPTGQLARLGRRFHEITVIDFFKNPLRSRVEAVLARIEESDGAAPAINKKNKTREYLNRVWITRTRPGIDRVSSAWLIRRFIDPKARYIFGDDPASHSDAVPFDMFSPQGFGHRGNDCTFETLCKHFAIRDARVRKIAQMIHDADLDDEKYGRIEAKGLDQVLNGWARQGVADGELLRRGMDVIEGLYQGLN